MNPNPVNGLVEALERISTSGDVYSQARFDDEADTDYFLRWINRLKDDARSALSTYRAQVSGGDDPNKCEHGVPFGMRYQCVACEYERFAAAHPLPAPSAPEGGERSQTQIHDDLIVWMMTQGSESEESARAWAKRIRRTEPEYPARLEKGFATLRAHWSGDPQPYFPLGWWNHGVASEARTDEAKARVGDENVRVDGEHRILWVREQSPVSELVWPPKLAAAPKPPKLGEG